MNSGTKAFHVSCPLFQALWSGMGKAAKAAEDYEGRGENPTEQRIRGGQCFHSKAALSENQMHSLTTHRLPWWKAVPEVKQCIQGWAVIFSLSFFFLTERWKPILFLLQNWRTSGFLNTSVSQLKDVSFQFPFQGLWFSFARVTANSACFPRCLQCCLLMQHKSYSNTCNWFHM